MKKTFLNILLILVILTKIGFCEESMGKKPLPTPSEIFDKIKQVNPTLKDYSVPIKIKAQVKYHFLKPRLNLEGVYYFKKPDKYKLELKRGSHFLNKYPKIFGWSLPKLSKFNANVKATKVNGQDFYVITLKKKVIDSDLLEEKIWVNAKDYTFPIHEYYYKNNGKIIVNIKYRKEGKYTLFDSVHEVFDLPSLSLSAVANAFYGKYKVNQGLSDEIFNTK